MREQSNLERLDLQTALLRHALDLLLEAPVVVLGNLDARKQVGEDGLEEDGL